MDLLPTELLFLITDFLSVNEIQSVSSVSRRLRYQLIDNMSYVVQGYERSKFSSKVELLWDSGTSVVSQINSLIESFNKKIFIPNEFFIDPSTDGEIFPLVPYKSCYYGRIIRIQGRIFPIGSFSITATVNKETISIKGEVKFKEGTFTLVLDSQLSIWIRRKLPIFQSNDQVGFDPYTSRVWIVNYRDGKPENKLTGTSRFFRYTDYQSHIVYIHELYDPLVNSDDTMETYLEKLSSLMLARKTVTSFTSEVKGENFTDLLTYQYSQNSESQFEQPDPNNDIYHGYNLSMSCPPMGQNYIPGLCHLNFIKRTMDNLTIDYQVRGLQSYPKRMESTFLDANAIPYLIYERVFDEQTFSTDCLTTNDYEGSYLGELQNHKLGSTNLVPIRRQRRITVYNNKNNQKLIVEYNSIGSIVKFHYTYKEYVYRFRHNDQGMLITLQYTDYGIPHFGQTIRKIDFLYDPCLETLKLPASGSMKVKNFDDKSLVELQKNFMDLMMIDTNDVPRLDTDTIISLLQCAKVKSDQPVMRYFQSMKK